jgi:SAM-dependent methyltransferase
MTQHEHGEKKSLEFKQLEWTDDNVARFWRWQGQFPATYFTYQFGRQIADRLRAPLAGRISIIDYGCGPGFLIPHLSALGKEVTATDFSPDALDNANLLKKPFPSKGWSSRVRGLTRQCRLKQSNI